MYIYKDDMFCEFDNERISPLPKEPRLATAYVPFQHAKCIYSAEKGICNGTIFPDLVMPYSSPFDGCGNVIADYEEMHCEENCMENNSNECMCEGGSL